MVSGNRDNPPPSYPGRPLFFFYYKRETACSQANLIFASSYVRDNYFSRHFKISRFFKNRENLCLENFTLNELIVNVKLGDELRFEPWRAFFKSAEAYRQIHAEIIALILPH